ARPSIGGGRSPGSLEAPGGERGGVERRGIAGDQRPDELSRAGGERHAQASVARGDAEAARHLAHYGTVVGRDRPDAPPRADQRRAGERRKEPYGPFGDPPGHGGIARPRVRLRLAARA